EEEEDAQGAGEEVQAAGESGQGRRRRRRRRGRRGGEGREAFQHERAEFPPGESTDFAPASGEHDIARSDQDIARSDQAHQADDGGGGAERPAEAHGEGERRRRRRGRRGGRRNRRGREGEGFAPEGSPGPELASAG